MRTADIKSGFSENNYNAKRRIRLMLKDPHCHWCRRELRLYDIRGGKLPPDYPTIDHLKDKFLHGKRPEVGMKQTTLVLACPKCNNERTNKIATSKHKFKTWWKAGAFPPPFRWFGTLLKIFRKQKAIWSLTK